MAGEFDGTYHRVPFGFVYVWERLGWKALPRLQEHTPHGYYGIMMKWEGEGEPIFPDRKRA